MIYNPFDDLPNMLIKSFCDAFIFLFTIIEPYIVSGLKGALIFLPICYSVYNISKFAGCSEGESRKNASNIKDIYDIVSSTKKY